MPMTDADPDRHRQDYKSLGLDSSADWETARDAYRRSVNVWHPDRYTDRPRERMHAQKRFIELTKSFDRLRIFYRLNGRLPLETESVSTPRTLHEQRVERSRRERLEDEALERPDAREVESVDGFAGVGRGTGGRGGRSTVESREGHSKARRRMLLVGVVTLVLGTLVAVAVIDGDARRSNMEAGREVLRDTPPSEFLPSRDEIRKGEARGGFIEREQKGKPGDQLMRDLFR